MTLELLSNKSQSVFVAQQSGLPEGICDLLKKVKTQQPLLDEQFTGNPKHLITICDTELGDNSDLQIFNLLAALVHELIKKALVKMEDIGADNLATAHVRKRHELLVITNARLQQLDYCELKLSTDKEELVNNIGIFNVKEKDSYLHPLFREFFVSLYLINNKKYGIAEIQSEEFKNSLSKRYPPGQDFTIALELLKNYETPRDDLLDAGHDFSHRLNLNPEKI